MIHDKLYDEEAKKVTRIEPGDVIFFDPQNFLVFIERVSDTSSSRLLFWDDHNRWDNKEKFYWNEREFEHMVKLIATLCGLTAQKFEGVKLPAYKFVA